MGSTGSLAPAGDGRPPAAPGRSQPRMDAALLDPQRADERVGVERIRGLIARYGLPTDLQDRRRKAQLEDPLRVSVPETQPLPAAAGLVVGMDAGEQLERGRVRQPLAGLSALDDRGFQGPGRRCRPAAGASRPPEPGTLSNDRPGDAPSSSCPCLAMTATPTLRGSHELVNDRATRGASVAPDIAADRAALPVAGVG